jgi:hypothetical protein
MNDDERGNELPISEADTTPPNPANEAVPSPNQGWQMPEPKFQQSSGYLPQGYLEKLGFETPQAEASGAAVAPAMASAPASAPSGTPDVEPQPDLSDQLVEPQVVAPPKAAVKERSTASRVVMIVLGLLAMATFIAAFLAVVYYLFLAPQAGGSTF